MKKRLLLLLMATASLFVACRQEPDPENPNNNPGATANAYVVNEGLWGGNNAELSLLSLETGAITNNYFSAQNGRGLGDLAQDALVYGSRLYVVVSSSNTLEVIDPATGKSCRQISFGNRNPRYLDAHEGKIYVTCYDKTIARIDTSSLTIEASCPLSGMRPEGICAYGNKLYVCNSWQYASNGSAEYDNTLSIVDIPSFREEKKVQIPLNPQRIMPATNGELILNYSGNYADVPAGLALFNTSTEAVTDLNVEATGFDVYQGNVYLYNYNWSTGATAFYRINLTTREKTAILENCPVHFVSVYGINVNPANGNIMVTDSQNYLSDGDLHCFSPSGSHLWSAETTVGPSKVVFL